MLNNASKTSGDRATPDHVEQLSDNVTQCYWHVDATTRNPCSLLSFRSLRRTTSNLR